MKYAMFLVVFMLSNLSNANKQLFNDDNFYYWSNPQKTNYAVVRIKNLAPNSTVLVNQKPWKVSQKGQLLLPFLNAQTVIWQAKDNRKHAYRVNKKGIAKVSLAINNELEQSSAIPRSMLMPILNQKGQDLSAWLGRIDHSYALLNKQDQSCELAGSHHKDVVILVHGLGRTKHSMSSLAKALRKQGKATCLVNYPSKSYPIEMLSDWLATAIKQMDEKGFNKIHIVTHSMGGILTRYALHSDPNLAKKIDKIVMLAPPNHGSEVIDKLGGYSWFKAVQGPAALQLFNDEQGLAAIIPSINMVVNKSTLIIAGTKSSDPWFNHLFVNKKGQSILHDGKVSVQSATLEDVKIRLVKTGHTLIMNNKDARKIMMEYLGVD
jgi:pimeloyl-ACP methyl ester carboxylesterase